MSLDTQDTDEIQIDDYLMARLFTVVERQANVVRENASQRGMRGDGGYASTMVELNTYMAGVQRRVPAHWKYIVRQIAAERQEALATLAAQAEQYGYRLQPVVP